MKLIDKIKLVVPLFILGILSLYISEFIDYKDFLINMGAEILGIIITLVYVDILIAKYEKSKWRPVGKRLKNHILKTSNTITMILKKVVDKEDVLVEYQPPVRMMDIDKAKKIAVDMINDYNTNLRYQLDRKLHILTDAEWDRLIKYFSDLYSETLDYQTRYNAIASPDQIKCIMEIDYYLSNIMANYKIMTREFDSKSNHKKDKMIKYVVEDINLLIDTLYDKISKITKSNSIDINA